MPAMDLTYPPEAEAFRAEIRAWLEEHLPEGWGTPGFSMDPEARAAFAEEWNTTLFEGGWICASWPKEYGGKGLSTMESVVLNEEFARAGAPLRADFFGDTLVGPTILQWGTEEQKKAFLPGIMRGQIAWCQGFSEPDAGSDLASLQTRGEVDGDEIVVTGQKIWTSFADVADWQELLVRTDRSAAKHKGITWMICDMHTPGIEVRPIETMDGDEEFCEVFYDEVRIPKANVVGEINDGWSVAMSTLGFERGTAFTVSQVRLSRIVEDLIEAAGSRMGPGGRRAIIHDEEFARRLGTVRAEVAALRAMTYGVISRSARQGSPGPEGSLVKLCYSELAKRVYRLAYDILGGDGLRFVSRWAPDGWSGSYLYSYAISIGGGTSEIQRNIVGERVLGLPRA